MRAIIHIDFNSFFATVEQQANPRLRGKPIGVTGGDRMERTVIGAASIEAKKYGIKTGMTIREARNLYPGIILVKGDSEKYLECTKRFINILKDYSPNLEIFSIDECFLEFRMKNAKCKIENFAKIAEEIKTRIRKEVGEWISCSIGISYNKFMAKLAGSLYKPNGLVVIADEEAAKFILDRVELDDICGIGHRIKKRLNNMGVFNFSDLRKVPLESLLASFKTYGLTLYNFSRGIDHSKVIPFYEKEEVKSIGHRLTIDHNTKDKEEIKQVLLKLSELVVRRARAKKLVGKTVTVWFRLAFNLNYLQETGHRFFGDGMQTTIPFTNDGMEVFKAGWKSFLSLWNGNPIRMIGISLSNLKLEKPDNLSFLDDFKRREVITKALDTINDKYGEFTLQRGVLLTSVKVRRMPNPFLADRRFKI